MDLKKYENKLSNVDDLLEQMIEYQKIRRQTMSKQPDFPFDMTGYTCFSIINCPMEQAIQLLKEYPGLCAAVDRVPFSFRIAALPEDATWTLLRWIGEGLDRVLNRDGKMY